MLPTLLQMIWRKRSHVSNSNQTRQWWDLSELACDVITRRCERVSWKPCVPPLVQPVSQLQRTNKSSYLTSLVSLSYLCWQRSANASSKPWPKLFIIENYLLPVKQDNIINKTYIHNYKLSAVSGVSRNTVPGVARSKVLKQSFVK